VRGPFGVVSGRVRREVVALGAAMHCPQYIPKRQVAKIKCNGLAPYRSGLVVTTVHLTAARRAVAGREPSRPLGNEILWAPASFADAIFELASTGFAL